MNKNPSTFVVIGRGYGDEGKGLATSYIASLFKSSLVVRHNGGAQSGHTVETPDKRFVFHELSSGSINGSDTFWASTFYPDLYKLSEEMDMFNRTFGFVPEIYADSKTNITIIYDVLLNMAIESIRGTSRHGSCGMGINEADLRTKAGFGITMNDVASLSYEELKSRLKTIKEKYLPQRLKDLGITWDMIKEYINLFEDENVLTNSLEAIKDNVSKVTLCDDFEQLTSSYEAVIFESGQGLLLDSECEESLPHVTASKTGLTNPVNLLRDTNLTIDKVVYVMRSYVTKHGAGHLNNECDMNSIGNVIEDSTNLENPWQGKLRYGKYSSVKTILRPVINDLSLLPYKSEKMLLVTHLNETNGHISLANKDLSFEEFIEDPEVKSTFDYIGKSYSRFATDIEIMNLLK